MSDFALFISVEELKKYSIMDGQLDPDKVMGFIENAQEGYIQDVLGDALYGKLFQLKLDGELDLPENSDYKTLLDRYIKKMHIFATQVEFMEFSRFEITNGGLYQRVPDGALAITETEVSGLREKAIAKVNMYKSRLLRYLCENSSKFPELGDDDLIHRDQNEYISNMNLF